MRKYNYFESMKKEIKSYLEENDYMAVDILADSDLYYNMLLCVTGSADGSYFGSSFQAQAALAFNWDLINEMMKELNYQITDKLAPEDIDISIRKYLFPIVLVNIAEEENE